MSLPKAPSVRLCFVSTYCTVSREGTKALAIYLDLLLQEALARATEHARQNGLSVIDEHDVMQIAGQFLLDFA